MTDSELLERYFLARILWWRDAIQELEAAAVADLTAVLNQVEQDLLAGFLPEEWTRERARQMLSYCDELLAAAGEKVAETVAASAAAAGTASLTNWNNMLTLGGAAKGVQSVALSREQIKSWFQDTPLGGHSLNEWVEKAFDSGIRKSLQQSLRKSQLEGLGYEPMTRELQKEALQAGQAITRREAITLARTYTQTANVEAQKAVYDKNADIVYAYKWTSILDNRVCPSCASLDGRVYQRGEAMPPIPLHPRCRCLLLPCVRIDKMHVSSEELDKVARPWVIREPGSIDAGGTRKIINYGQTTEDFGGWYKTLPEKEQVRIVGPVRAKLLAEGKINFGELVDKRTGRLRTLAELGFSEGGKQVLGMPPAKESFIEKITGAKPGTPESILKNAQAVNPNYGQGKGYDTNCQRCVPTYELRRRGHDVEAMPNDEKIGSGTSKRATFGGWECFKDAKVEGSLGENGSIISKSQLLAQLQALPEGARAGILWMWPDASRSHIIVCEKLGPRLLFIDPQNGMIGDKNLGNAHKRTGYSFFRMDSLELDESFEWNEIIKKRK